MRSLVMAIKKWIAILPVAMSFPLAAQWLNQSGSWDAAPE